MWKKRTHDARFPIFFYLKTTARDNLFLAVPPCSLNDTSQREFRAHFKGSGMKEKTAVCVLSLTAQPKMLQLL
jgi:hypothetical protein